ncbi:MAG: VOC family protein [Pirellulales bacterium]|jgi:catechol 2,3-dioxygenase-like lactoylglutathione lyase family enzyme|nr:VOC family protein [Pirellulales bacterium]
MPQVVSLVEACLYVDDLDAAVAFYHGVLGMDCVGREEGRHVFFSAGTGVLLCFLPEATLRGETLPPHGARGPGHAALGIAAADFDNWRAHLQAHGVQIEHEAAWPRGGRSLYVRDPAGNSLELVTPGLWGLSTGW